jgi:hypothetical protein
MTKMRGDKYMGVQAFKRSREAQNELARPVRKDGEGERAERDEAIQVPGRCRKREAKLKGKCLRERKE